MSPHKPISEKQLAANRANAKKSTGPRGEAGKQTVSLNAVRHGLAGNTAVLPEEDRAAHQAFCGELLGELAPATAMELNLAQSIANDLWRLNRAAAIEINMFAVGVIEDDPDPDHDSAMQTALAGARTFINHANKFGLLSLYEQRINRAVHKNMAELRRMQAERQETRVATAPWPIPVSDLQTKTAPNGFVYANDLSAQPPASRALGKAA